MACKARPFLPRKLLQTLLATSTEHTTQEMLAQKLHTHPLFGSPHSTTDSVPSSSTQPEALPLLTPTTLPHSSTGVQQWMPTPTRTAPAHPAGDEDSAQLRACAQ